jgi:hypothetical protein
MAKFLDIGTLEIRFVVFAALSLLKVGKNSGELEEPVAARGSCHLIFR